MQPLLLTLDEVYLLTAAPPDLGHRVFLLGSSRASEPPLAIGEGNGKPLQYSCLENPMHSMKRQKDRTLKDKLPRSVGAQYAAGDQWRNNSRKNEGF